jgi:LmbE family N-acetylglucosaminyl deacetylase
MFRCRNILALGAHPDDSEYGCFGFLLRQKGDSAIHGYVGSLGSVGGPSSGIARRTESLESFKLISLSPG